MKKTHRSAGDFDNYLKIVKRHIKIIPLSMITPFLDRASIFSPDPKDTVYLALALKLNCGLWSNDKHLKDKQSQVVVFTTGDLLKLEQEK